MTTMELPAEVKAFFKAKGRKGGKNTVAKYGKTHFSNAGKLGMAKRWGKGKQKDGDSAKSE